MKKLILAAMAAMTLLGQEVGKPQHAQMIRLERVSPRHVYEAIMAMVPKGTQVSMSDQLQTITFSGPPEVVAMLVDNIRKLDAPPPPAANIEIVAYMVLGTQDAAVKTPEELAGVVKQLKGLFPFAGYKLIETMIVRGRAGAGGEASGMMQSDTGSAERPLYQFKFSNSQVQTDEKGKRIRLSQVKFGARVPVQVVKGSFQYVDVGVNTDVDVREGQKVVIGKASLGPGQESLFLVMSAKVVD